MCAASPVTYLVFGDLHGRILPAFRLAVAWAREHGSVVTGLLQVGDLGYFPDPSRLDKATVRHASNDPLELGVQLVTEPSRDADAVFHAEGHDPGRLWFTAGNHEDFKALAHAGRSERRCASFPVDAYERVRCIRNGAVESLPGPLRVAAVWGIDDEAPNARRVTPVGGCIQEASLRLLAEESFDVLLSHDGPRDAVLRDCGSKGLAALIELSRPAFAFFGHYGGHGGRGEGNFGRTQVYHVAGFEMQWDGSCAEPGSVGVLVWDGGAGTFEYVDESWLRSFTRHNWRFR